MGFTVESLPILLGCVQAKLQELREKDGQGNLTDEECQLCSELWSLEYEIKRNLKQ